MSGSAPFLSAKNLSKVFGGIRAVESLDLDLAKGEMLAVIGPNGCGKTTLFNLLTGRFAPDSGDIAFAGANITGLKPYQIARLGIGRKFQVPGIYPDLTVRENLEVPFFASRRKGPLGVFSWRGRLAEDRRAILAEVALTGKEDLSAGALSHGEKQWLEIAMLLASKPRLMLLDEPTAGMTFPEATATAELIARLQRDQGIAIIVIEHDIAFVEQLACEVAVMMKGSFIRRGSFEEVRNDPEVKAAYLGGRK